MSDDLVKDTKETKDILSGSGKALASSPLFTTPLEDLTTDECHFGWSVLDLVEKAIKPRKDEMRVRMMQEAQEYGLEDPKGSLVLDLGDGQIKREKRRGKDVVREADLRALLKDKGINPDRCFAQKIVTEFDPEAFKQLIADGIISEEEVKECFTPGKITWALKVQKPSTLPKALKP